nr:RagB/SusD family nutrient uptake outer membrane protein [uncultured Chitinophaga sp.]
MKKTTLHKVFCFTALFFSSSVISCKKFLEVGAPSTSINQENVYKNDYTASAVLTGLYTQMMNDFNSGGITSLSLLQEMAADNLVLNNLLSQGLNNWWRNSFTPDYSDTGGFNNFINNFYPKIYIINAAIEGIAQSRTLTPSIKNRLLGEAYFLRSFYYFYIVNLFGETPLVLTTDYTKNASISRSSVSETYQQIIEDLKKSISFLDDNYVDASISKNTNERVRPNLATAQSLLSRVYLYTGNYSGAESISTEVINKKEIYDIIGLDSVFKKNSKETIWSLQPVKTGYNTDEAATFLLTDVPGAIGPKFYYLSNSLISSFDAGDNRLQKWIGNLVTSSNSYPFAAKYKADINSGDVTEYCVVFRLAEQFLIRSEARAHLNNIQGALLDLNKIRIRASLPPSTAATTTEILNEILHERRVELFTEWGHRWFDIKRTGTMDAVMQNAAVFKGSTWSSYKEIYPIPNTEILKNKNLRQNPGY